MPEPITAPMPSAVRDTGPSVFFSAVSGCSLSAISLSMDLVAKICRGCVLWRFWIAGGRCHVLVEEDEAIVCGKLCKAAENGRSRGLARLEAGNYIEKPFAVFLSLRLTASQLLHLLLLAAARIIALRGGSGLLARSSLDLLALCLVSDALCICHVFVTINFPKEFSGARAENQSFLLSHNRSSWANFPPAFWCRTR
jgi:hypothetical protein